MTGEEEQIILEMAIGPLAEDNAQGPYCIFCDGEYSYAKVTYTDDIEFKHKPFCPIVRARHILVERGTPLNIYKIDGEVLLYKSGDGEHWFEYHSWGLETLLGRALQRYSTNKRNVTATFVDRLKL